MTLLSHLFISSRQFLKCGLLLSCLFISSRQYAKYSRQTCLFISSAMTSQDNCMVMPAINILVNVNFHRTKNLYLAALLLWRDWCRRVHLTDWDWDSIPGGIGLLILLLFSEPITQLPGVQLKPIFKANPLLAFGSDIQPINSSRYLKIEIKANPNPNLDLKIEKSQFQSQSQPDNLLK